MRGDPTADAFGYNDRSEVTSASIMGWSPSPATASYGYDGIGNLQQSTFNAATNAYTANSLNQYTSILCDSVTLCEPTYDTDGNMLTDGALSFTYDAASRLKTVSSNGVTLVTNFYDAKSRRVKKVTSVEMGGRRMWRPRVARVVASRGQELEVTIRGTLAASTLARHCEATRVSLPREGGSQGNAQGPVEQGYTGRTGILPVRKGATRRVDDERAGSPFSQDAFGWSVD